MLVSTFCSKYGKEFKEKSSIEKLKIFGLIGDNTIKDFYWWEINLSLIRIWRKTDSNVVDVGIFLETKNEHSL